jgi:benzoylformate decarboxylase
MTDTYRTGADLFFETLKMWGIERVYICPGTTEASLLDASLRHPEVRMVLVTHESVAVAAADGEARVTGGPAAVFLHTNVGLTNGLSHLYAAYVAYSPVVVFNGIKPQAIQGRYAFTHSRSNREFVKPYVRWDWHNLRVDDIGEDTHRALQAALSQPGGPTFLAFSQDLLSAPVSAEARPRHLLDYPRARPDQDSVERAVAALVRARRPVIVVGGSRSDARTIRLIERLSNRLFAPVLVDARFDLETVSFPTTHPNYAGLYSPECTATAHADVMLIAGSGTPIDFEDPEPPRVRHGVTGIHLCADADQLGRSHPTDVALLGDLILGLADLSDGLDLILSDGRLVATEKDWLERTRWVGADGSYEPSSNAVRDVVAAVAAAVPEDSLVVSDAVTAQNDMLDLIPRRDASSYMASASGSLGWGAGAAIGAAHADPDRRVVAMLGDGVFQFGIQALWTAKHYELPITFVVYNNQMYLAVRSGMIRLRGQALAEERYPGVDISGPDIAAIARGFGLDACRVHTAGESELAVRRANEVAGPSLVEVMIEPPSGAVR